MEEFQFTFIFWEKVDHVKFFDFLCEQIFFVHEKNDGGVVEPWVGDDGLEQQNTFFHTTLKNKERHRESISLEKNLILIQYLVGFEEPLIVF